MTDQIENESALDRMRADMAGLAEDSAKRDNRLILAIAAMIALATTVLGILVTAA